MSSANLATDGGGAFRVELLDISQTFGDTTVLHGVTVQLAAGEIHSLVGQNGAGKSTLTKILGGIHPEHAGRILIDGTEKQMTSPRVAARNGVGIIYQELSLIPSLSVAENIMLGIEPGRIYNRARTRAAAAAVIAKVDMLTELPLDASVGSLSTGLQQRVEIAKALSRDSKVLVMDEPTARLSGPERDDLRTLMLQLASGGLTIIYISHFLEEIFKICHTVTVLRNGYIVDSGKVSDFTMASLTRAMLNQELAEDEMGDRPLGRPLSTEPVIELEHLSGPRLHDINLQIHRGEIVGLAGLVGSGRTRLAKTIVGAEPVTAGTLRLLGRPVRIRSPRQALLKGVVLIPESRKTEGIIGLADARMNMIGMALDRGLSRFGVVNRRAVDRASTTMFTDLEIRPAKPGLEGSSFSGGNQQKLLMARALLARPEMIVADQPTAGVDVGTKAQIHQLIRATAASGTTFLIVSDDLDELLALSDRIVVLRGGSVIALKNRSELTRATLVNVISDFRPAGLPTGPGRSGVGSDRLSMTGGDMIRVPEHL